jgi:tetratricopeptide (TPR) repeat protein
MGLLDRFRGAFARDGERADAAEIERALEAFELDRIDAAEAGCERVLARDPRDARALHLLGLIAAGRRDQARAAVLIQSAIAADPAVGLYHFNLGNALRELGRADDAAAGYARATTLDPGRFAAWFNLAQLHAERRDAEQAIGAFREALRIEPGSAQARVGLAGALVDTAQGGVHTAARSAEALALLETDWPRAPNPWRARFSSVAGGGPRPQRIWKRSLRRARIRRRRVMPSPTATTGSVARATPCASIGRPFGRRPTFTSPCRASSAR